LTKLHLPAHFPTANKISLRFTSF